MFVNRVAELDLLEKRFAPAGRVFCALRPPAGW